MSEYRPNNLERVGQGVKTVFLSLLLLMATATIGATSHAQAPLRKLAFYDVQPATSPANENGTLPEAAWAKANVARTYYEYWKPNPAFGELKTEFRMLYDERGIYLKVTNFDEQLDKVRATMTNRDDPHLWTDDCAQIYFDPQAQSVGHVIFTVNSLGTQSDSKRLDAAVMLSDWSGTQWHAVTKKDAKSWIIEAFFPWADLGAQAKSGDIWMFDHVRYGWGTGKFIGVTWSPGGNYTSPDKFGYLHFSGKEPLTPPVLGKSLSQITQAPWVLPLDSGLLLCSATGEIRLSSAEDTIATYRADFQKAAQRALEAAGNNAETKRSIGELQDRVKETKYATTAEALEAVERMAAATAGVNDIYWRTNTSNLIERTVEGMGKGELK